MSVARARQPIEAEPGTPEWGVRLVRRLNDFLARPGRPVRPVRAYDVADAASLPDPADYRLCVVYVVDIGRLAVSDGAAWLRQDTGAPL